MSGLNKVQIDHMEGLHKKITDNMQKQIDVQKSLIASHKRTIEVCLKWMRKQGYDG